MHGTPGTRPMSILYMEKMVAGAWCNILSFLSRQWWCGRRAQNKRPKSLPSDSRRKKATVNRADNEESSSCPEAEFSTLRPENRHSHLLSTKGGVELVVGARRNVVHKLQHGRSCLSGEPCTTRNECRHRIASQGQRDCQCSKPSLENYLLGE